MPAIWEPLVSPELFLTVRRRLTDPSRRTSRPGRGVHLLSMIGRCDVCGGVLAANYAGGAASTCAGRAGTSAVDADALDDYATTAMLTWLARPESIAQLTAEDDHERGARPDRVASPVQAELDDLADSVGAGDVTATLAGAAEPAILERLRVVERELDELTAPASLRGLIEPGR